MNNSTLNKQDVINLAASPTPQNKAIIADKLSTSYGNNNLSATERSLAEDIFRIMIKDTEIRVREALSNSLKKCVNLPNDIVKAIITDRDSVAAPFLQYYSSLSSDDLIKILKISTPQKQKAIAKRKDIPFNVSQYIAEECIKEVIEELVSNEKTQINEQVFNIIIDKFPQDEDINQRIVYRSEIPPTIAEKIVDKLSNKLKTYLLLNHNLPKDMVSNLVEDVKERITLSISEEYSTDNKIEELVRQLYKANRLSSGMVVRAICLGDIKFFEYALVYLSETPIAEVRKILFNPQADFMVRNLLRKALLPKSVFPAIFSALKIINEIKFDCETPGRKDFGHKVIERILSFIRNNEDINNDDINYLLSKIN